MVEWLKVGMSIVLTTPIVVSLVFLFLTVREQQRVNRFDDYYRGWLKYLIDKEERTLYGDKKAPIQPPPIKHPARTR